MVIAVGWICLCIGAIIGMFISALFNVSKDS